MHLHVKYAVSFLKFLSGHDADAVSPRFPKTYPRLACATFAIEKPINGVSDSLINRLSTEINQEAQKLRGFEMVFTVRPCSKTR